MRVLMIDNYDSFTYNLVQYLQELGAEVLVHRNDRIDLAGMEALDADRLMISPARARPTRRASRWKRSAISPASCRFSACAWATRPWARRSAARWCARAR